MFYRHERSNHVRRDVDTLNEPHVLEYVCMKGYAFDRACACLPAHGLNIAFHRAPVITRSATQATASLDAATEQRIWAALDAMGGRVVGAGAAGSGGGGVTVVNVAHRLETVMESDRVLVIDAGRVAEDGPPKVRQRCSLGNRAKNEEITA